MKTEENAINKSENESYDDRIFRLWANGTIQPNCQTDEQRQDNHTFMMDRYVSRNQ